MISGSRDLPVYPGQMNEITIGFSIVELRIEVTDLLDDDFSQGEIRSDMAHFQMMLLQRGGNLENGLVHVKASIFRDCFRVFFGGSLLAVESSNRLKLLVDDYCERYCSC